MLALFPSLGFQEMFVILVIGLLLYGRDLPEAGRRLGRITAQLKRTLYEFKRQLDEDADIEQMKRTLDSTRQQIKQVATVKRAVIDPKEALADLTNATLSSPLPRREAEGEGEPSEKVEVDRKEGENGAAG